MLHDILRAERRRITRKARLRARAACARVGGSGINERGIRARVRVRERQRVVRAVAGSRARGRECAGRDARLQRPAGAQRGRRATVADTRGVPVCGHGCSTYSHDHRGAAAARFGRAVQAVVRLWRCTWVPDKAVVVWLGRCVEIERC